MKINKGLCFMNSSRVIKGQHLLLSKNLFCNTKNIYSIQSNISKSIVKNVNPFQNLHISKIIKCQNINNASIAFHNNKCLYSTSNSQVKQSSVHNSVQSKVNYNDLQTIKHLDKISHLPSNHNKLFPSNIAQSSLSSIYSKIPFNPSINDELFRTILSSSERNIYKIIQQLIVVLESYRQVNRRQILENNAVKIVKEFNNKLISACLEKLQGTDELQFKLNQAKSSQQIYQQLSQENIKQSQLKQQHDSSYKLSSRQNNQKSQYKGKQKPHKKQYQQNLINSQQQIINISNKSNSNSNSNNQMLNINFICYYIETIKQWVLNNIETDQVVQLLQLQMNQFLNAREISSIQQIVQHNINQLKSKYIYEPNIDKRQMFSFQNKIRFLCLLPFFNDNKHVEHYLNRYLLLFIFLLRLTQQNLIMYLKQPQMISLLFDIAELRPVINNEHVIYQIQGSKAYMKLTRINSCYIKSRFIRYTRQFMVSFQEIQFTEFFKQMDLIIKYPTVRTFLRTIHILKTQADDLHCQFNKVMNRHNYNVIISILSSQNYTLQNTRLQELTQLIIKLNELESSGEVLYEELTKYLKLYQAQQQKSNTIQDEQSLQNLYKIFKLVANQSKSVYKYEDVEGLNKEYTKKTFELAVLLISILVGRYPEIIVTGSKFIKTLLYQEELFGTFNTFYPEERVIELDLTKVNSFKSSIAILKRAFTKALKYGQQLSITNQSHLINSSSDSNPSEPSSNLTKSSHYWNSPISQSSQAEFTTTELLEAILRFSRINIKIVKRDTIDNEQNTTDQIFDAKFQPLKGRLLDKIIVDTSPLSKEQKCQEGKQKRFIINQVFKPLLKQYQSIFNNKSIFNNLTGKQLRNIYLNITKILQCINEFYVYLNLNIKDNVQNLGISDNSKDTSKAIEEKHSLQLIQTINQCINLVNNKEIVNSQIKLNIQFVQQSIFQIMRNKIDLKAKIQQEETTNGIKSLQISTPKGQAQMLICLGQIFTFSQKFVQISHSQQHLSSTSSNSQPKSTLYSNFSKNLPLIYTFINKIGVSHFKSLERLDVLNMLNFIKNLQDIRQIQNPVLLIEFDTIIYQNIYFSLSTFLTFMSDRGKTYFTLNKAYKESFIQIIYYFISKKNLFRNLQSKKKIVILQAVLVSLIRKKYIKSSNSHFKRSEHANVILMFLYIFEFPENIIVDLKKIIEQTQFTAQDLEQMPKQILERFSDLNYSINLYIEDNKAGLTSPKRLAKLTTEQLMKEFKSQSSGKLYEMILQNSQYILPFQLPEPKTYDTDIKLMYILSRLYQKISKKNDYRVPTIESSKRKAAKKKRRQQEQYANQQQEFGQMFVKQSEERPSKKSASKSSLIRKFYQVDIESQIQYIKRQNLINYTYEDHYKMTQSKLPIHYKRQIYKFVPAPKDSEISSMEIDQKIDQNIYKRVLLSLLGYVEKVKLVTKQFHSNSFIQYTAAQLDMDVIFHGCVARIFRKNRRNQNILFISAAQTNYKLMYICTHILRESGENAFIISDKIKQVDFKQFLEKVLPQTFDSESEIVDKVFKEEINEDENQLLKNIE